MYVCLLITLTCSPKAELRRAQLNGIGRMMHMKGASGCRQTVMNDPGAQQPSQMFLIMVGRLLQNSTMYICMQQSTSIQLQNRIVSLNDYIHSTSTLDIFIQRLYSFNFNTGYFCARQIFIQLQRP